MKIRAAAVARVFKACPGYRSANQINEFSTGGGDFATAGYVQQGKK